MFSLTHSTLKRFGKRTYFLFAMFGLDLIRTYRSLLGLSFFMKDFQKFRKQMHLSPQSIPITSLFPCLGDRFDQSDQIATHYFHQDLHIARKVFLANPRKHVDVGSSITGFIAHVASFREIEVLDIRNVRHEIPNVIFKVADITDQSFPLSRYCDSVSCLHVIEHLGLGRYGDTIDVDGHKKGLENLARMLEPKGKLYLSVPIGPLRIEFNAHRVFSVRYLLELIDHLFTVNSFSYVDDDGNFHVDVSLDHENVEKNYSCSYGCGIFEMIRND